MKLRLLLLAFACAVGVVAPAPTAAADEKYPPGCAPGDLFRCGYIDIPARADAPAVSLAYNVRLPDAEGKEKAGPFPTALSYQGYTPSFRDQSKVLKALPARDYAVLMVNVRGSACSGGGYDPFSRVEARDAKYVIDEWLQRQEWANGDVAMVGVSYGAILQIPVAAERPEHLVAIAPLQPAVDLYRDALYPGGVPNTGVGAYFAGFQGANSTVAAGGETESEAEQLRTQCAQNQQGRAVSTAQGPTLVRAAEHPYVDEFWAEHSAADRIGDIDVPVLLMGGWQDQITGGRAVESMSQAKRLHAVLFNGRHVDFDQAVDGDRVEEELVQFLDHYVKGADNGYDERPRIQVWWEAGRQGPAAPGWVTTQSQWPAPSTKARAFALGGNGSMSGQGVLVADGSEQSGSDTYAHAPGTGQGSLGGRTGAPAESWGLPSRPGTALTYTTPPLTEDLTALGPASLDLWLSSTASDTDVQVTLSEIRDYGGITGGQEVFVQQGWLRASHRAIDEARSRETLPYHPHTQVAAAPLTPGQPAELRVEILPFAHLFREGSQIRVTIEAAKGAGDTWGFAPAPPASNTVHHDAQRASRLVLGVLPGKPAGAPRTFPACGTVYGQPCRPAVG